MQEQTNGHYHPMTLVLNNILKTYTELGFEITEGPLIETDWYNFEGLNMRKDHPARDAQDTFFLKDKKGPDGMPMVLRTQISQMQLRYPEQNAPPFKIVYFGKVFRNETLDARHEAEHSQIEVMVIGKDMHLGHMKGIIEKVLGNLFGGVFKTRMRPGHFPFVEPGVEVEVECFKCRGKSAHCSLCGGEGWVEILGAGIMNPVVLKNAGIDTDTWQGFAYSFGWDRLTLFKYGIDNIRLFNSGDLRVTNQF